MPIIRSLRMAYSGHRIRVWRRRRGLSQAALADRVGTNANTIGEYERGITEPSVLRAERIADALGITLLHLTRDEPVTAEAFAEPPAAPYGPADLAQPFTNLVYVSEWDGAWPLEAEPRWPVPRHITPHDECLVTRVADDSMRPFLCACDAVVIDPHVRKPLSLAVVVVRIAGAVVIRRYKWSKQRCLFVAANPTFPPVEATAEHKVLGLVVGLAARNLRDRFAFEIAPPWP